VSLRMFHLVFIAMSVVLAAFFAAWSVAQYRLDSEIGYLLSAVGALGAGAGLAVYGARFQRRTRHL